MLMIIYSNFRYTSNIKIGEVSDEVSIKDSNFSRNRKLATIELSSLFLSNRKEITHGISHEGKIFISKYFLKAKKYMMATLDFEKKIQYQ